jgi:hypothetical protein
LACATPAYSITRCVNPPGTGGCFASIQAAVTAASAADVIRIGPGTYFENVTVPAGKDGLQLIGASNILSIIDPDAPNAGSAIVIQSNGVTVMNLAIRNGQANGIDATANNTMIRGVRVGGLRGPGVGIATTGTGSQLLQNEVRGSSSGGIMVTGDNAVVKANSVTQISDFGIIVLGNGARVQLNRVSSIGTDTTLASHLGVEVLGNLAQVISNTIENVGLDGLQARGLVVTGTNPLIQGNRLVWAGSASVSCTTCTGGKLLGNAVLGSTDRGFVIAADASGFVAQMNRAGDTLAAGFEISGTAVGLLQNNAYETGLGQDCFGVFGTGHTLTSNMASRCGRAGFYTQADTLSLATNQSTTANTGGFLIDGDSGGGPAHLNVTLTGNKSIGTNGQGFAIVNAAANTVLTGNTGLRNRVDLCDLGSGTNTSGGNTWSATPPTTTVCDIQ